MNDFTASNGVRVRRINDWTVDVEATFERYGVAIREFFRAEEDERLGRWRWPDDPEYVVYAVDEVLTVIDETDGSHQTFSAVNRIRNAVSPNKWHRAAAAFLDAHPGPKPWHDAKPDDVWILTIDGEEVPALIDGDREFHHRSHHRFRSVLDESITAGRRIWPEVSS